MLASLAPLWGAGRWQNLISTTQNIHIPLDACESIPHDILSICILFDVCILKFHAHCFLFKMLVPASEFSI